MADLEMTIDHELPAQEAITRLDDVLVTATAKNEFLNDSQISRNGSRYRFSGKVKGVAISGVMDVFDMAIQVRVKLPWSARLFRPMAEKNIRAFMREILI